MSNENSTNSKSWLLSKQAPITVIGVLVLGIVGSTLYDLLVKPGLSTFGRFCLDIITLGSITVKDYAYASAALDPTPVTSLYLLKIILMAACFPAARMIASKMSDNNEEKLEKILNEVPDDRQILALKTEASRLKGKLRILELIFWTMFMPWFMVAIVSFSVHNQSVLVWRVFNANITIISPVMSDDGIKQLRASFCSMKSRTDFIEIQNEISRIAKKNRIETIKIETW